MNLTLRISGLNLERLLRSAGENGVRLKNVRRADERTMCVTVSVARRAKLAALCERYGWQMTEISASPMLRCARAAKRRWTLGMAMMLGVLLVFASSQIIWLVEITGAGENVAEVRRCLERENARVGRLKKSVSTDSLAAALSLAVPGLAHAAARYEGSALVVACQQAREGEHAGVDGRGADIVAEREGIIVRISAESGTPKVKIGQAVRKGQTLIVGQERTGGGELRACRAQGEIVARCFARGEARVRLNVTGTVETGEIRRRVRIESPKGGRTVRDAEDFDHQDVSVEIQPIVGLYLPVWRRVETLARIAAVPRSRTLSDARSQAQGAAEKMAKLNCPSGVEILDKWVDYSMIDDEFVYAAAVLVFEAPIGTRHGAD